MIAPNSYGALSTTSAKTIQGSRPGFTGQSGAKKLGFKIGNTTYSESAGNLSTTPGAINNFNAGLRLDEFNVMTLTAADFNASTDYEDSDGDGADPLMPFTMSTVTKKWLDRNGNEITDYSQALGCSGFNMPLTLKITLPNVQVHSKYGNPRHSIQSDLVKEYKIGTASGICFAKPNSLDYWNGTTPNATTGGGYNSTQFDPNNGFKASLNTKFPTTGFPKASFTLIMTSNPTDYTFTHNGGSAVTVGTDGKVTLNSKPSGPVTIKAKLNGTSQEHEYTFNPTTVWVVPKSGSRNYASAVSACGGANKIPSRAQLTNSPQRNAPQGWSYFANYYTRAVGGGVFGEWGYTTSGCYPGSQWVYSSYWTRDPWSTRSQFDVNSNDGYVGYYYTSSSNYGACLE
ncbi:hypothetical protein RCS94_04635 [Orbaceae bacterium ac157xtp]